MNSTKNTTGMANQAISSSSSSSAVPIRTGESLNRSVLKGTRMTYSRVIGALFLLGFLSYGVGNALVASVTGASGFLSTISAHQFTLVLGAFLMLLNTPVDVGKAVLFFPILEKHGKRTALAYLAAMIIEVVFLTAGVLCLLIIPSLAQHEVSAGQASAGWANALGSLAVQANTMAYQIAEMSLGLGGIFLCALLFRVRLIPRWLAGWGLIGYAILLIGFIAEIFGIHISLIFSIPGGLFELALGIWLLIKGFQPEAYGQVS